MSSIFCASNVNHLALLMSYKPSTTTTTLSLNIESPTLWLVLYFFFNLSLTLYNKSVLIHFPFPYTLTAIHAFCGTIGTWILLRYQSGGWKAVLGLSNRKRQSLPKLSNKESFVLFLFSFLYTINIVVSNASLRLVTVPFHQVVRASTPFFTLIFSALILRNNFKCTTRKVLSLIPVVAGVGFATYGDYYFTSLGFLLTLLGTVLAALKTIITHLILIKPSQSSKLEQPPLPLHSPVGHSTVPLPSEKENVFYRHRTFVGAGSNEDLPHSLLLSPSTPPTPSPPTTTTTTTQSSFQIPKLKLTPLHLLSLLSPLAFIQTTLLAHFTGELHSVSLYLSSLSSPSLLLLPPTLSHSHSSSSSTIGAAAADAAVAVALSAQGGGYLTRLGEWVHLNGLGGFQLKLADISQHVHIHVPAGPGGWGVWLKSLIGGWNGSVVDPRLWLLLNGVMAFWLNVVSFNANRRIGALGMTVAANVKQVLTILLAVLIFDLTITPANGLGIGLTILGGGVYAMNEYLEKEMLKERQGARREA